MRKLQHAHLPKTRQFIPNRAESGNRVQKVDIKFLDKRLPIQIASG